MTISGHKTTIAVDMLGGNSGINRMIEGIHLYLDDPLSDSTHLILVGPDRSIRKELGYEHGDKFGIMDCSRSGEGQINRETTRNWRTSLGRCVNLVSTRESSPIEETADVCVSAEDTTAFVFMASRWIGKIRGANLAIAGVIPNRRDFSKPKLALDLGATSSPNEDTLVKFALMGEVYMRHVLERSTIAIGLANIGTEDHKGDKETRRAHAILQKYFSSDLGRPTSYVGGIEGNTIFSGPHDVLVANGFSMNLALKVAEEENQNIFRELLAELDRSMSGRTIGKAALWVLKRWVLKIKERYDKDEYGGAEILGLKGRCIVAHGSSSAKAIKNAIIRAHESAQHNINDLIENRLAQFRASQA